MAEEERVGLDTDELPRAIDAIRYLIDPWLRDRLDRLERQSSTMIRETQLPRWSGELPNHMVPNDWGAGYLNVRALDPLDFWNPELNQLSPQALLRDLFRPERETFWCELERNPLHDRGGIEAMAEARAAQKRDPLPVVEPLVKEVMHHRNEWRKILRGRWLAVLDDNEPRKVVPVIHDPTINW